MTSALGKLIDPVVAVLTGVKSRSCVPEPEGPPEASCRGPALWI